jgi:hypothetical protein
MNYETMDWEAEAIRVARAFGIKEKCEFRFERLRNGTRMSAFKQMSLYIEATASKPSLPWGDVLHASCDNDGRTYDAIAKSSSDFNLVISFEWDGELMIAELVDNYAYVDLFAKGLFHLGLLTEEVEAELKIYITAHQKLEWALEYEERIKTP